MATPQVVLVTGVARYLGAHLAARLADDPRIERVIGVDAVAPSGDVAGVLGGVDVQQVDLRTPAVLRVIRDSGAEVVAHMAVATAGDQHAGRSATKELNVIGTLQLLAASQQVPSVRKVVVRSSTAAYGASFRDPAIFTEDTEPREMPRGGFAKDILDIEGYVRGFRRRRPDVAATVLRFAPFLGSQASTRLARYLSQAVVPTVLGRDPRLQFVHIDDAFEVLHRSVVEDHPGTFNVAGRGTLTLSQAIRRAGGIGLPIVEPGLSALAGLARGKVEFSLDQLDLFVHGRVVDTRHLVREFGFEPRSTAAAFDDFLSAQRGRPLLGPDAVRAAERAILESIRQVRAARSSFVGRGEASSGQNRRSALEGNPRD